MELTQIMIKLGWYKYDGNIWGKGDLQMSFDNAVINELERLSVLYKTVYVCPDCGYTINCDEFIYQQYE
jgi:hypothetical protein